MAPKATYTFPPIKASKSESYAIIGHVNQGSVATRSHAEFTRIGLGIGDQLGNCLGRNVDAGSRSIEFRHSCDLEIRIVPLSFQAPRP